MEYSFSTREKNGSICLILSYKVNSKWKQKTKQGFKTLREAKQYQDKLLAADLAQIAILNYLISLCMILQKRSSSEIVVKV